MTAGAYETNSLSWQLRQAAQRLNQGFEYWFSQLNIEPPPVPDWACPAVIGRGLFWAIVIGLALWLSWLLYRGLISYRQRRQALPTTQAIPASPHSSRYWWQQAQAHGQAGRYADACRALYLAALQQLDETQTLLQDPSRTDGEYLLGIERLAALRQSQPYQLLIRTHERIAFGDAAITAEVFQRCRRAYQEIQK